MTHLRIEQEENIVELNVSGSIVAKLYNIAIGGLDNTSSIVGSITVPSAYRAHIEYLTEHFPEFHIHASDYAIPFEDQKMVEYLNSIGVGSNGMVTESDAASATVAVNSQNTEVTKFNELKYFTSITSSKNGWTGMIAGNILFGTDSAPWTSLEEVDISNFTSLGHNNGYGFGDTFNKCTALKKVTASSKLSQIGYRAFYNCTDLEDIIGLSGEIEVAAYAFYNCQKLKQSSIDNCSFTFVPISTGTALGVFYQCKAITDVVLSQTNTYIPTQAFRSCINLTTLTNNGTLITIGSRAFELCTNLVHTFDLSDTTSIGEYAFYNCSNVTISALPKLISWNGASNVSNCNDVFRSCKISATIIPKEVSFIKNASFLNSNFLNGISFESGSQISLIGERAFYGSNLSTLTIPEGLTMIHQEAFRLCLSLTYLDLPSTISTISRNIVTGDTNLTTLVVRATTPPTLLEDFVLPTTTTLYVPDNNVNDYKTATYWSNVSSQIKGLSELPS